MNEEEQEDVNERRGGRVGAVRVMTRVVTMDG